MKKEHGVDVSLSIMKYFIESYITLD